MWCRVERADESRGMATETKGWACLGQWSGFEEELMGEREEDNIPKGP